jgi:hypothetical protein
VVTEATPPAFEDAVLDGAVLDAAGPVALCDAAAACVVLDFDLPPPPHPPDVNANAMTAMQAPAGRR